MPPETVPEPRSLSPDFQRQAMPSPYRHEGLAALLATRGRCHAAYFAWKSLPFHIFCFFTIERNTQLHFVHSSQVSELIVICCAFQSGLTNAEPCRGCNVRVRKRGMLLICSSCSSVPSLSVSWELGKVGAPPGPVPFGLQAKYCGSGRFTALCPPYLRLCAIAQPRAAVMR